MAPRVVVAIDQGWLFKQADLDDSHWLPVSQFPTNVHLDLLAHNKIPDPFIGKNEEQVQWVGEKQWAYKTTFVTPASSTDSANSTGNNSRGCKTVIAFDGLDTFATVVLNGHTILESDNMFLPARVDVTATVRAAGEANELSITFDSAYLRGWKLVEQHADHKWGCWNGDNSRLAVRKAQYHWGWDWGPTLLTCGPWRPVRLEVYDARIADLFFETTIDESLKSATVVTHAVVEIAENAESVRGLRPTQPPAVRFDVSLGSHTVASETVRVHETTSAVSTTFYISSPALWYPARYGDQPLYTVRATLLADGNDSDGDVDMDVVSKKIGLRHVELVQTPLQEQPGKSFFFRVNNVPIFCGGSDWIPADSFLPRITRRQYVDWVQRVVDGNQCMMRVWGGGVYEDAAFYEACDVLGVLVWQDFMFGCGNYPAWPALRTSIRREAEANVRLLRHHPCIVLWAGNNEDYQYQEDEGLTYDFTDKDAEHWLQTDFPARYIYEKILAETCAALVPDTAYHFGSPWSGSGASTRDPTVGDIHQWNVWHGTQERYQNFGALAGRFVSEFGMEALPSVRTIDGFLAGGRTDPERYAQSATLDWHNKAAGQERRLALYLAENLRWGPDPLEQYVYSTQLIQAECVAAAYRLWRRQWQGPGREYCGGVLVWQTNDCWPVTSWSICDYHGRPKHAYYAIKREMTTISVGMARRTHVHARSRYSRVDVARHTRLEVWGSNLALQDRTVDCIVRAWDIETGRRLWERRLPAVMLRANRSVEIGVVDVDGGDVDRDDNDDGGDNGDQDGDDDDHHHYDNRSPPVIAAYLVTPGSTRDDDHIARTVNWPEPLKYLHLATPAALTARLSAAGDVVEVSAEVPVKGVALEVGDGNNDDCDNDDNDDAVAFADNLVDIVPGEVVRIGVCGATAATRIRTRYLGMAV